MELQCDTIARSGNTHCWGKDHCAAGLQFNNTGTDQKKNTCYSLYVVKQLNPNLRLAIQ